MNNPDDFQITTDFATLKNDSYGTVTVSFPGSQSIPGSQIRQFSSTIGLGVAGSSVRARIASSKNSNTWYACSELAFQRTGVESGFPASYSTRAVITRQSPTVISVWAVVLNPYSGTLVTEAGNETFSFEINTFLPPF